MNKKQQEEQQRQEDLALKNGLLWVAGAAVLEMLLFVMAPYAFDFYVTEAGIALAQTLLAVFGGMRLVGLAVALVCGVLAVLKSKKEQNSKWFVIAAVVGAVVMLCGHVALEYESTGMKMLYLLIPVLGGLALCYYIYQREFFLAALPVVVSVLGMWFVRVNGMGLELAITALVGAALVAVVLSMKKKAAKSELTVALVSAIAALAIQIIAAVAGGMVAYYLIYVMAAWLFALLVYYTVKMM